MHEQRSENESVRRLHKEGLQATDSSRRYSSDAIVHSEDEMLPIYDAARRAGVTRAALLSWIRNGFIEAQTSRQGWVVRAGDVEAAQRSSDEARMGLQYFEEDRLDPRVHKAESERVLDPAATLMTRAIAPETSEHQLSNTLFSPLAEFVRDQADVIQEQAETIGWLQAELRRTREQLDARTSEEVTSRASEHDTHAERKTEVTSTTGYGAVIDGLRDQFAQSRSGAHVAQPVDDRTQLFEVVAEDPFSDDAARARMAIEESERRISGMWHEHEERRMRHTAAPSATEQSLLKWLTTPWKRRTS